jgi:hypothetical protein
VFAREIYGFTLHGRRKRTVRALYLRLPVIGLPV